MNIKILIVTFVFLLFIHQNLASCANSNEACAYGPGNVADPGTILMARVGDNGHVCCSSNNQCKYIGNTPAYGPNTWICM